MKMNEIKQEYARLLRKKLSNRPDVLRRIHIPSAVKEMSKQSKKWFTDNIESHTDKVAAEFIRWCDVDCLEKADQKENLTEVELLDPDKDTGEEPGEQVEVELLDPDGELCKP